MKFLPLLLSRLFRRLAAIILIIVCLIPASEPPVAQAIEVVVEDPQLYPAYITCKDTYWYPLANNRGHTAYLTLNTNDPTHSTNHGEWHPVIAQAGYYRVEAYIADHDPIIWCTGEGRTIPRDTTEARYSIHHFYGVSTRSMSQYPLSNQWLNLGEYYFSAGSSGYVSLTDFNGEVEYSTTVSLSAMRFTFTRPTRPQVYLPLMHYSDPSGRPPPDVGLIQGQGFDACHLPTISEMQTWWSQSPYSFYGLYLGGIHLPSICTGVDAGWVKAVHQQGWSFVPTWVGPQAPCSGYTHKMSTDPVISYHQGRQEAEAASAAAAALGLTNYGWGGTVIYYDLETFGGASLECRQSAASFINGWVERLEELGNIAGGYGAHNSYIEDWATLENIPNDIWVASWYANGYDPYASVNGISWLIGLWTNHQRIRQYAGDHSERWGGVQLGIDSDVADGMVAMPPAKPLNNPMMTSSPSIEDTGWLSTKQGWLVSGNLLYWTNDRGESWVDRSPAPIQLAYFLPGGQTWALSVTNQERMSLYHSSDTGTTWENIEIPLASGSWWPLQLQFNSPTTGWVVMQKEASQVFSSGILMRTNDGGITWQTSNLPLAAKINFSSQTEGWLLNNTKDKLYHTTDGGLTWQAAQIDSFLLSQPLEPEGTILSGWQTSSLGWAVTSKSSCIGEKINLDFTCQVNTSLWQTVEGGQKWVEIPLPIINRPKP